MWRVKLLAGHEQCSDLRELKLANGARPRLALPAGR